MLAEAVAGELIRSEIEIRSGRGENFADAVARQREARARLFALAAAQGALLGATGTHPWSPWQEQQIIDTEHYRRVEERAPVRGLAQQHLQRARARGRARRGAGGAGLRPPAAGAAGAARDLGQLALPRRTHSGLHSARSQIFTKSFPRCGIPDAFGGWRAYADYVDFLVRTNSIVEFTQVWWSVRPHHSYGTVEMRICDAQTSGEDSTALAALITACVAQAALDHDEGVPFADPPGRLIEENFWRAIRHGLDGKLIDLERAEEYPAAAATDRLLAWTAPGAQELGGSSRPAGRERRAAPEAGAGRRALRWRRSTRRRWR